MRRPLFLPKFKPSHSLCRRFVTNYAAHSLPRLIIEVLQVVLFAAVTLDLRHQLLFRAPSHLPVALLMTEVSAAKTLLTLLLPLVKAVFLSAAIGLIRTVSGCRYDSS